MKIINTIFFLLIFQANAQCEISDLEAFSIIKNYDNFVWILDKNQSNDFYQFVIRKSFVTHLKAVILLTFVMLLPLNLNDEYTRQRDDFLQKFGNPHLYDLLELIDKCDQIIQLSPESFPYKMSFCFLSKIFEIIAIVFFSQGQGDLFFDVSNCQILAEDCQEKNEKVFLRTKFCIVSLIKNIWPRVCNSKIFCERREEINRKFNIFKDIAWNQVHFSELPVIRQKKQFHQFLFFDYNEFVFIMSKTIREITENSSETFSFLLIKIHRYFNSKQSLLRNNTFMFKQKICKRLKNSIMNTFSRVQTSKKFIFNKNKKSVWRELNKNF